jgi:hypothetical protein
MVSLAAEKPSTGSETRFLAKSTIGDPNMDWHQIRAVTLLSKEGTGPTVTGFAN